MKTVLLGAAALITATASQASVQIGFTSPAGDAGTTNSYSNGSYSVTAYGYSNFNFTTGTGTSDHLYDKTGGGDENGVGLLHDRSGDHEIWYVGDNFTTIPAVILDVSSLLSKASSAQFMMGSTTSNEQWIIRGWNGSVWTSLPILTGSTELSWINLPGWGSYQRYAFYSGGTVSGSTRTSGNVLLSGILLAPVPEPGTWAMMLLGFGCLGLALRRRQSYRRVPDLI